VREALRRPPDRQFATGKGIGSSAVRAGKTRFFERAGGLVCAAPKEKKMKRTLSICLGLLAVAAMPVFAQQTGKIHGHITNPSGAPQTGGTVTLVTVTRLASGPGMHDAQTAEKGVFQVDPNGDYAGEAQTGTYTATYRTADMGKDKTADQFENVKIVAGQDTLQDFDMSRKEYIEKLSPEQQKQLEELRGKNSQAMKANEVIKNLNNDLKQVTQDIKDADNSRALAQAQLGATASKADLDAKTEEIKNAKYTEIETLMKKDTGAKPDASVLWADLGQAEVGLKKYDDAAPALQKALDLEGNSKKPNAAVQGLANSELGEVNARQGKVAEANAAYEAAAKINPTQAAFYLRNEAVIFFQMNNADAQMAAANEALKIDPTQAVLYYIIGQALVQKATIDPKTQRIVLPDGCAEAYQKYLDLAPTGPYAADAKGILDQAGQKINNTYKADKKK
jgi:Tetratricopeptide repeat